MGDHNEIPDEAARAVGDAMDNWLFRAHGTISSHSPGKDDGGREARLVVEAAAPFIEAKARASERERSIARLEGLLDSRKARHITSRDAHNAAIHSAIAAIKEGTDG